MDALAIARVVGAVVWGLVAVWTTPSFWREMTNSPHRRSRDATWTLIGFIAVGVIIAHFKWIVGITAAVNNRDDYQATLALVVLWDLLAIAVLRRRWVLEGWRL